MNLKLEKKVIITGQIELLTGLHIGGSSIGLEIGGADSVVVRNPIDKKPYIPGSSIKGKMRSLIEKILGKVNITNSENELKGEICKDIKEDLVQFFGFSAADISEKTDDEDSKIKIAPTRFIVRDAKLSDDSFKELENSEYTDMYLTELKTETNIDRLTSKANPRTIERVPAGAKFDFDFIIDIYNCDIENNNNETKEKKFLELLKLGIKLLEDDYLGGNGSRGYGKVKFHIKDVIVKTKDNYINEKKENVVKKDEIWDKLKSDNNKQ